MLRKEHDDVFGTDISRIAQMLKEQPALLKKCPFILAVIKETLPLYSLALTLPAGWLGIAVTARYRNSCPMYYVGATILRPALHSNPFGDIQTLHAYKFSGRCRA